MLFLLCVFPFLLILCEDCHHRNRSGAFGAGMFQRPVEGGSCNFPCNYTVCSSQISPIFGEGFNYNKLRTLLASRVRVGVQLDSDQFVAPGYRKSFGGSSVACGKYFDFEPLFFCMFSCITSDAGADYMFNMTEREITKDYPIPILPVHYFSRLF